jgi:hypothetical protein
LQVPGNSKKLGRASFALALGRALRQVPACARDRSHRGFPGTFVAGQSSNTENRRGALDFQGLVDLHYAALYRFAMSLTSTETDAGDLVQETFLAWATKGHQLQDAARVQALVLRHAPAPGPPRKEGA